MDRVRAAEIYAQGEDAVIDMLVALSEQVQRSQGWAEQVDDLTLRLDAALRLAERLASRVEDLELEVKRLKGRSSRNSSLPPSQDLPGTPKRDSHSRSNRKRGGQRGSKGNRREAVAPDKVDETIDVYPAACSCGADLTGLPTSFGWSHQVTEIPPVTAYVTEYRLHSRACPECKSATTAALPAGVHASSFGPRLHGATAALAADLRASRVKIAQSLQDLFSIRVSVGGVDRMLRRTATALDAPYAEALAAVRGSPHVNVDETGWAGNWMWGAFTQSLAVYRIDERRNKAAARRLLGPDILGRVITSDRHGAYNQYADRQVCWSHIQRNIEDLMLRSTSAAVAAPILAQICRDVFDAWHTYKHDGDRAALTRRVERLQDRTDRVLNTGSSSTDKAIRSFCRRLRRDDAYLFTFAHVEGVEPTNNHAERGLRPAVIHRRVTGGTHTAGGHQTLERILTATQSCRQQRRSAHDYLTQAVTAHFASQQAPTLLPT